MPRPKLNGAKSELVTVLETLRHMPMEDLKAVSMRCRTEMQYRQRDLAGELRPGQRVRSTLRGFVTELIIDRVNQTTVSAHVAKDTGPNMKGARWKIAPSFLTVVD